jgi:hypothetical protein
MTKLVFPKKEDLQKKSPEKSLETVIKLARKVSNREAKAMRIQFIDQAMPIHIDTNNGIPHFFDFKESDLDRKNSILKFLEETTGSTLKVWPSSECSFLTKMPIFLVTDKEDKAVFDEKEVCYAIIQNPTNGQITINTHKGFEDGYVDSSQSPSKWHKAGTPSREYFTVYPSGLCDYVSFKAENVPDYNKNYAVNPLSGIVEKM